MYLWKARWIYDLPIIYAALILVAIKSLDQYSAYVIKFQVQVSFKIKNSQLGLHVWYITLGDILERDFVSFVRM